MKGIILAAGKGTRLYPTAQVVNKQLIPVYDKPLIYYPLTTLLSAGIREILIISSQKDVASFQALLGDGSALGISISYEVQHVQCGIADAFRIGESFIGDDPVCLILGDNIFWNKEIDSILAQCAQMTQGALVFGLHSEVPQQFGVIEFDKNGIAISIEEKPINPKSNFIVPGLYFFDAEVTDIAKHIKPSARGEYEITSVIEAYLKQGTLKVLPLSKDTVWFDAGTPERILEASIAVRALQKEYGVSIGCVEEASCKKGYITAHDAHLIAEQMKNSEYGKYLFSL
ncbi:MAG: glucose-1-phosphate thymidylyltransferase RfbA [Anaerofustis sp.]